MTTPSWTEYNFNSGIPTVFQGETLRVKLPTSNSPGIYQTDSGVTIQVIDGKRYLIIQFQNRTEPLEVTALQVADGGYAQRIESFSVSFNNSRRYEDVTKTINDVITLTGITGISVNPIISAVSSPNLTSTLIDNSITCTVAGTATVTVDLNTTNIGFNIIRNSTFNLTVTKVTPAVTSTMSTGILQVPRIAVTNGVQYTATYTQGGQVVSQPRRSGPYQVTVTTTETATYAARTVTIDFTFTRGSTARLLRSMGINYPYRR